MLPAFSGPRNETTRSKYVSAARRCAIGGEPENNRDRRAAMNLYRHHLAEHVAR